jgi:hypothetical protein
MSVLVAVGQRVGLSLRLRLVTTFVQLRTGGFPPPSSILLL